MASSTHIVRSYSEELEALDVDLAQMGGLAESHLSTAIEAIARRDDAAAERVIAGDARVDALDRDVQSRVYRLLALRQPVAIDLRTTISAIRIASELERVADLAKNTAKRALVLNAGPPLKMSTSVLRLGRICLTRLADVLNAYAERDAGKAMAVWGGDNQVDELFNSLFSEILTAMAEDAAAIDACTHLAFVAKNFERIGDHATNIAEAIHFLVVGEHVAEERPKGDVTSSTSIAKSPSPGVDLASEDDADPT